MKNSEVNRANQILAKIPQWHHGSDTIINFNKKNCRLIVIIKTSLFTAAALYRTRTMFVEKKIISFLDRATSKNSEVTTYIQHLKRADRQYPIVVEDDLKFFTLEEEFPGFLYEEFRYQEYYVAQLLRKFESLIEEIRRNALNMLNISYSDFILPQFYEDELFIPPEYKSVRYGFMDV
uniref:HEPN domain-containing protein n=1 Tax=Strongyloides venezuelensis TaxID=75913 RepID=A0A0K0FSW6_STRVS